MAKIKMQPGPFVVPMPVVLVGADVNGKANFMPAAFVSIVNGQPTTVACGLNPKHYTCRGIEKHRTFSLNLPGPELVEATDWCGLHTGEKVDKSGVFETFSGELSGAPMIRQCRMSAECKLTQTVPLAVDTVYFGEVVAVHVDDDALVGGKPDWTKIAPMLFTFPDKAYRKLGDYLAPAWEAGKKHRSINK
jgi:flavin reductase (DIM6/NTAB) family NADH-FMN oxidoreductase RutF